MPVAEIEKQTDRLGARARDSVLFEYVFAPELAPVLSPRPYFHPVRTLGGVVITDHQPSDHRWHLGITYSWPVVNGLNFWGGPTFVRGQGYQQLDNNGQTRHLDWNGREEHLEWLDPAGAPIAVERRRPNVSLSEFEAIFESVKNWGRWGPDDVRGTLGMVVAVIIVIAFVAALALFVWRFFLS